MALVRCAECGKTISQHAASCPSCGVGLDPMSDDVYARARASRQATRTKDRQFTLLVVGVIAALAVMGVLFGKSNDERRAESERAFRRHVSTLEEQKQKQERETEQFWRGVGMEKRGERR